MLDKVKIITTNCDSLVSHSRRIQLQNITDSVKPDFVMIQETHFNANHRLRIKNYQVFSVIQGNGTAILVNSKIACFQKQVELEHIYGCFVEIDTGDGELNWLIGSLYVPCSSSFRAMQKDLETLNKLGEEYHCIFGGDLNARHPSWCTTYNTTGQAIHKWLSDPRNNFIRISPDKPTRNLSKLDHFMLSKVNFSGSSFSTSVFDTFADHKGVLLQGRLTSPLLNIFKQDKPVKNFIKANWDLFEELVDEGMQRVCVPNHRNASDEEIDSLITEFNRTIKEAEDTSIPLAHKHNNKYANIPPLLTDLFKLRQKLRKALRRERRKTNPLLWKVVELKYTIARTTLQINSETSLYMKKTIEDKITKLKPGNQFFREVNNIIGQKNFRKLDHLIIDNKQIFNPQHIKTEFTSFYNNLYKEQTPHTLDINITPNNITDFSQDNPALNPSSRNPLFTTAIETRKIIKKINSKKSSGPDEISNYILKKLPFSAIKTLTSIFNHCTNNNYFPAIWKSAKIFPIPKGKNSISPENFRPISLTSNVGKILEAIIMRPLLEEIDEKKLIPKHQFGFRKGHSTVDALAVVKDDISRDLNKRKSTVVCLLDFEKAFDSVWTRGLLYKLANMGINKNITAIIKSFLTNRSADVIIDNTDPRPFNIRRGVPQGTRLGPILYNLYIGDIPIQEAATNNCKIVQYADDTIIYASSLNPSMAAIRIQRTTKMLEKYFQKWGLNINGPKSRLKIFTPQGGNKSRNTEKSAKEVILDIKGSKIQPSPQLKYLGVTFDRRMKFNKHIDINIKRATCAFFRIAPIMKKVGVDIKLKAHLYKQLVRPIITYGFPIWISASRSSYQLLEKLERRIMRSITGKYRRRTIDGIRWTPDRELRADTKIDNIVDHLDLLMERSLLRTSNHTNELLLEQMNQEIDSEDYFVTTRHLESIGVGEYARTSSRRSHTNRG